MKENNEIITIHGFVLSQQLLRQSGTIVMDEGGGDMRRANRGSEEKGRGDGGKREGGCRRIMKGLYCGKEGRSSIYLSAHTAEVMERKKITPLGFQILPNFSQ